MQDIILYYSLIKFYLETTTLNENFIPTVSVSDATRSFLQSNILDQI